MVPRRRNENTRCHLCDKPKVWMLSHKWSMKHAEEWGFWSKISIRYTDVELMAQSSRCRGKLTDRVWYQHEVQERLGVEPQEKKWKGWNTRFYQMWVPGLDSLQD